MKYTARGLFLVLALCGSACSGLVGAARTSEVAQGEHYRAGSPEYDRFFDAVYRWQTTLTSAPGELKQARQWLSDAVLDKGGEPAALAEKVRAELERIGGRGARVHVELVESRTDPSAARAVFQASSKPRPADAKLLEQLQAGVTQLLRLKVSLRLARVELNQLCADADRLETNLETAPPPVVTRDRERVVANLRDAERLLALMLARSAELSRVNSELLGKLAVALGPNLRTPYRPLEAGDSERVVQDARGPRSGDASEASDGALRNKPRSNEPATRAEFEP